MFEMFNCTIKIDDCEYMNDKVHADNLHDYLFGFAHEYELHGLVELLCDWHDKIVSGQEFTAQAGSYSVEVEGLY